MASNNFFGTNDPLNLNSGNTLLTNSRYNTDPIYRIKYNSDANFRKKADEDERKRQEELRKQAEASRKQHEQLLAREKSQKFANKLSDMLHGKTPMTSTDNLWKQAEQETIYSKDPKTGKLKYSSEATKDFMNKWHENYVATEAFKPLRNDVNNLVKLVNSYDDEDSKVFSNDVYKYALNSKQVKDKKDFDSVWNNMDTDERVQATVSALGEKYLKGDQLKEFKGLDPLSRYEMLCALTAADPRYKTLSEELKEQTEQAGNEASEGWLSNIGLGKSWRDFTDYATKKFMYAMAGGNGYDILSNYKDIVGGGAFAAIGQVGNMIGSAGNWIASGIYNWNHDGGEKEDIDATIRKKADAYMDKVTGNQYSQFMQYATDELKLNIVKEMRALSRDDTYGSSYYKLHEGDSFTKDVTDNELIKEYFKVQARAQMFGEQNAAKEILNYWQDIVADKQTLGDKTVATGAQLIDTFSADVASLAAVVTNPLFMSVDTHGTYDTDQWTVDGEGYSDALVKRNPLLKWASGLLETGCWSPEQQEKYKKLGLSKDQLYRTVDLENQFMSLNDIGDIIGQYGFTAATTAMSMGGSAVVKALATSVAKNALKTGVKGAMARSLLKSELKQAIKTGLASGATEGELTKAMEVAAQMGSSTLYKGNLAISALMGTSEGALEAKSTYDTFINENNARVDQIYLERLNAVNNATRDDLRNFMINSGYLPAAMIMNKETGIATSEFSEKQYAQAKLLLLDEILNGYQKALERVDDDACDAACANFISNSFINGALNVFGKELTMSKDARNSIRAFKGDKKLADLVSVEKSAADGKWHAIISKAVQENKDKSWWGNTAQAFKSSKGFMLTTKNTAKALGESNVGKILKNAGSEGLEEFSQNVSDAASRAAFLNDLNNYMETVYDKDAREQFMTDWGGIVTSGLNSITSDMVNSENIKAGLFGFLSTLVGGASPGAFISHAHKFGLELKEAKGAWGNIKAYTKWAASNLGGFYDGAIRLALADNNAEYATALRLQESTERWLLNGANQELLTHMGGAIGFANSLQSSLLAGDSFMAKNNHLGMAVENALMLKALKGTAMYDEYEKALQHRLSLGDIIEDEEQSQLYFDLNGNLNTNNLIKPAEGIQETEQERQVRETTENLATLVELFKNTNSLNMNSGMTDLDIIKRVTKNAEEMLELNNRIEKASQTLNKVFHQQDVDPLVQSTYIYAMLSQQDARDRRDLLRETLSNATDVNKNENLSEEDKKLLTTDPETSLNEAGISLAIEYGSIEKALKAREQLQSLINQLDEDAHSKKKSEDRKQARQQKREVEKQLRKLDFRLSKAEINIEDNKATETEEIPTVGENQPITVVNQEEPAEAKYPLFSVKDLVAMSPELRFEVLSNRSRYSDELNKIVDQFINITRRGMSAQQDDLALTNDEVEADYKDEYKLIEKSKAYDNYLREYINDPSFLNNRAGELQVQDRRRTLRFLYKDELSLRENETPLDMLDRIQVKIDDLKNQLKYQDALILLSLITENKDISKLLETVANITLLQLATAMMSPESVKKPEFSQAMMALQTIAANSNKSLDEIKEMFDNNDVDGISQILKAKLNSGESTLNRYFKLVGIELIDNLDNADLSNLIQSTKNYIDLYYQIKAQSERLGKALQVHGTALPTVHSDPANLHQGPATPAPNKGTKKQESTTLKITSPGEVKTNTPEGTLLSEFLKLHKASSAVQNLDNTKGPKVHFMVTRDFGTPQVFAVVEVANGTTAKKGVHYQINGKTYLIIGAVDATLSALLAQNATSTYASLNNEDKRDALLQGTDDILKSEFNEIGAPQSVGDHNIEDSSPLKDLLSNSIDRVKAWVSEFMQSGKRVDTKNEDGEKTPSFVDLYGYPVVLKDNGEVHIALFPIGNRSLAEILSDKSIDDKQKITLLKSNAFFANYFKSWETIPATTTLSPLSLYSRLIGDYFFLGYNYNTISTEQNHLNAKYANGGLTVDNWDHSLEIAFETPMSANNTAEKDSRALKALQTIIANSVGDDRNFTYGKPQLNWKIIENTGGHYSSEVLLNEVERIEGLIQAGLLYGFAPVAITRNMIIANPYAGNPATTTIVGSTSDAPRTDPATPGVVDGGKVDVATGQATEGNPLTAVLKVEQNLSEAVKRAKAIVDGLIAKSKQVVLNGTQGYTNSSTNSNYGRVTSAEQAFIGAATTPWLGTKQEQTISTAFGNIIDNTFRAALDVLNNVTGTITADELYERILKDPAFVGKTSIPCHTKFLIKKCLQEVIKFKQLCDLRGWHLVPKDIRAFGVAPVTKGGITVGTIPVAGTLDILVYDNEGVFHIIDMKTKNMDANIDTKIQDSSEGWTAQVSTYQALLLQMYPDMVFGQNYIMPIGVKYNMQTGSPEIESDGMTVKNQMAVKEPQMLSTMHGRKDSSVLEDYLYPIDTRAFNGYDFDRLSSEDLERVTSASVIASADPLITPEIKPETPAETPTPAAPAALGTEMDLDDFASTRTKLQSRFTEFINNHIANIERPKLNIVTKAIIRIKDLITHTGYIDKVIKHDLAATFFDGDVTKFERICGKDVSVANISQLIANLRNYFSAYTGNRVLYVLNISNRYLVAKLVWDLLHDNITMQDVENLLSQLHVEALNIPELVEYLTSDNPDETAKSIIKKMEVSKIHTIENYRLKLNEFTLFMDGMQAKLDFLNSGLAVLMLSSRMINIRESLLSNKFDEMSYGKSESIEDLLLGKLGNYGALKLLRGIATKSKNKSFRRLAAKLLREVKAKNLSINVTLDNGLITEIEGETKGKNITIYKTSLDNYEHLERVLLHEMLHSVVEASPEIRKELQKYLDATVSQLMKSTDMTKEEIVKQHYGLTNVDEFISEYFTNIAFLESLKNIADSTEDFNSIYDRVAHSIKSFFTGEKSIFDEVTPLMDSIIGTHNNESTKKETVNDTSSLIKTTFDKLPDYLKTMITHKGFTAQEFNDLPSVLQELLTKCCL